MQLEGWFTPVKVITIGVIAAIGIGTILLARDLFEFVEADEYVVIQSPVSGDLTWYDGQTQAGWKWQGWGVVTKYKRRDTYEFYCKIDRKIVTEDKVQYTRYSVAGGLRVRFNDGGHGTICGSIQYQLPSSLKMLNEIHTNYKGPDRIKRDLIETATNRAVYLVGTLMTSKESYAEKRNDLIHYVSDQVQNGVYRTRQKTEWVKDPITGQDKQIIAGDILIGKDGKPERQEESILNALQIITRNFAINELPYDDVVERQINQQQQITMEVQTSIAEKLKAEQNAMTLEQQGKANATQSKWAQETLNAKLIAEAEQQRIVAETQATQRLNVAKIDRDAAELTKQREILLGQGEGERKRLVLEADGALSQKLETYEKVMLAFAEAIKGGTWVPTVVSGAGANSSGANSVNDLISLLTAKGAKDLALDLSVRPQTPAAGPRR